MIGYTGYFISLGFMVLYYKSNNEWLLSINSIYNEIRNQETDEKLQELAERLSKIMDRIGNIIQLFLFTTVFIIWVIKWDYLYSATFGYLYLIFMTSFGTLFIEPIIFRENFICFFICFKYKILFRDLNQRLSRISVRNIKHLLSVHNRLCDSVLKANEYLGTFFIISIITWSPNCCYIIYSVLFSQDSSAIVYSVMPFLCLSVIMSFVLVFFALLFSIAYIDIEAKRGLHFVYGLGLKIRRKHQIHNVQDSFRNC